MNLEHYDYSRTRTYKEYHFYSEGPKGRIRKVVRFILYYTPNGQFYNLLLGDWNEELDDIDDKSVTNNGDTEKVLASVAAIVIDFTDIFRKAVVYATGNSFARTRRYQMGINRLLDEIEKMFYIYGRRDGIWETFQKNINYDAFLIERKEFVILEEQTSYYMNQSQKEEDKIKRVYKEPEIYDEELVDINTSPFVRKKMEEMEEIFKKTPLPKDLLERRKYE